MHTQTSHSKIPYTIGKSKFKSASRNSDHITLKEYIIVVFEITTYYYKKTVLLVFLFHKTFNVYVHMYRIYM